MVSNVLAFVIALALGAGVAFAIYLLLRRSAIALLDEVIGLPAGTTFYFRVLCLCVFLAAATGVLGGVFDLKPEARFMEYVWRVAAVLSSTCTWLLMALLVFLSAMTVLVAVLRRHDQR